MKPRFRYRLLFMSGAAMAAAVAVAAPLDEASARRFLQQASFGATADSVAQVQQLGKPGWLQQQFGLSPSLYAGFTYGDPNPKVGCPTGSPATCGRDNYSMFPLQQQFFANALNGPDQLRQRVAFALSQILVVSGQQIRQPYAMANFQNIFLRHAFGNFRDILRDVTLSPAMGSYLNMVNNDKANPARGTEPNENYAREVMQLFSVGLWQLNPDGTQKLGSDGKPVVSYDQEVVEGFAHVFTGWTYAPRPGATSRWGNPKNFDGSMVPFAAHHDTGSKLLLNGQVLPAGGSPTSDLEAAIDSLFNHPNVGPFIGRQLIQMLVTANPSPAYVARVSAAFNGAGGAPRGDMKATLSAVLLDPEASAPAQPDRFGKLRDPVLALSGLLRNLGARSDGVWPLQQAAALGEPVFNPPTVFSFFPPDYTLPEDPQDQGPAFGLFSAANVVAYSNAVTTLLNDKPIPADATVPGSTGTALDLVTWQALAGDPAKLVSEVSRVLFPAGMSASLRQELLAAVAAVPAANPGLRARTALFLAAMAPEYLVEH
ncbi:MAG: DUF1800 domain-containing protein [Burkholderiales bacterium]|nr:MAG: DUF1800 domain-containing protein [Burkholderiales bacterium]